MSFVQDDRAQTGTEEALILRPTEHVLQHRIVGNNDVRPRPTFRDVNFFTFRVLQTTCLLASPETTPIIRRDTDVFRSFLVLWCFAGEMEKGQGSLSLEPLVNAIDL